MISFKNNEVILFQGDSITDGLRGRNYSDLNHVLGHGYQYILGSEFYADNISKNIQVINRGVGGNRIADLYGRWNEDCLDLNPTVLSVLVGVNDVWFSYDNRGGSTPDRYEKIFHYMLDEVLEKNPNTKIVVMEPFCGISKNQPFSEYINANVPFYAEKARKVAEDYKAIFVPLQDMFNEKAKETDIFELIWDGVHPTALGHQLIARRWKESFIKE